MLPYTWLLLQARLPPLFSGEAVRVMFSELTFYGEESGGGGAPLWEVLGQCLSPRIL